jgi:hypothetical protein
MAQTLKYTVLSSNPRPTRKKKKRKKEKHLFKNSQFLLAHACNPNYSGGEDQEDHGSKPALPGQIV